MRNIIRQGLWIAGFTVLLAEMGLRLIASQVPNFVFFENWDHRSFKVRPGSVVRGKTINSWGYNADEFPGPEKKLGEYRIAAIGDSFVYAIVPRNKRFIELAEQSLPLGWRTLNFGLPGAGVYQYLGQLKEALDLNPDLVVLHVFAGNDLTPPRTPQLNFYLPRALEYLWKVSWFKGRVYLGPRAWVYDEHTPTFNEEQYLGVAANHSRVLVNEGWVREQVASAMEYLDQFFALCRNRGVPVYVFLLPSEVQVDDQLMAKALQQNHEDPAQARWYLPSRIFGEAMRERGVDWFDYTPVFREVGKRERLYKIRDSHWNLAGNRLAGGLWAEQVNPLLLRIQKQKNRVGSRE